jgi:hypothetical protein
MSAIWSHITLKDLTFDMPKKATPLEKINWYTNQIKHNNIWVERANKDIETALKINDNHVVRDCMIDIAKYQRCNNLLEDAREKIEKKLGINGNHQLYGSVY